MVFITLRFMLNYLVLFLFAISIVGCVEIENRPNFKDWQKENLSQSLIGLEPRLDSLVVKSDILNIDTIYRSMTGPYSSFTLVDLSEIKEKVIWLTGYQCKVFNAKNDQQILDDYLCHNNLNYGEPDSYPWDIKTLGSEKRIFTLTAGQTRIALPTGTGIPIYTPNNLAFFSQALNHNTFPINMDTYQEITIFFYSNKHAPNEMKALYPQTPFVTTQIGGPEGGFNSPTSDLYSPVLICGIDSNSSCHISYPPNAKYNPYADDYGRTYTGHWKLSKNDEVWTTNITNMLNLTENAIAMAAGSHMHPYAEKLELWDLSKNQKLHELGASNYQNKIGLSTIEYTSKLNISLKKNHQYALRSYYNCSDSTTGHTGMANMCLYIQE